MTIPYPPPPCSSGKGETPTPAHTGGTMTMAVPSNPRALLSDAQFNAVLATIVDDNPGMDLSIAGRILTDALAYLATAARTDQPLVPSRVVDVGWHSLLLHTGIYRDLCGRLGAFVHHYPERPDPSRFDEGAIERTIDAMQTAGYTVDIDLWRAAPDDRFSVAASCGQHSGPDGPIVIIPKPKG
ncbi:glycine-rich domain-containing protein [Streptomyces sp. NPDC002587]